MNRDKSKLQQRREFVQKEVAEQTRNGVKLQAVIYDLSETLFLTTRTIENDLYWQPKGKKNRF